MHDFEVDVTPFYLFNPNLTNLHRFFHIIFHFSKRFPFRPLLKGYLSGLPAKFGGVLQGKNDIFGHKKAKNDIFDQDKMIKRTKTVKRDIKGENSGGLNIGHFNKHRL